MWMRMLVSQIVRQAAEDKVKSLIFDQAPGTPPTGGELTPEQLQSDVLLMFGSRSEAGGWVDRLADAQQWPMDEATLYQGGSGKLTCLVAEMKPEQNSEQLLESMLPLVKPRLVVIAGFAVGLAPELGRRAIVLSTHMRNIQGDHQADSPLDLEAQADDPKAGVFCRTGLSQSAFPRAGQERESLFAETGAAFCDPDGLGLAEICSRTQTPWIVSRILTERADEVPSLPLKALLSQETVAAKVGAAVSALWNEPKNAGELWKIQEDALRASDRLAKFLEVFLGSME